MAQGCLAETIPKVVWLSFEALMSAWSGDGVAAEWGVRGGGGPGRGQGRRQPQQGPHAGNEGAGGITTIHRQMPLYYEDHLVSQHDAREVQREAYMACRVCLSSPMVIHFIGAWPWPALQYISEGRY